MTAWETLNVRKHLIKRKKLLINEEFGNDYAICYLRLYKHISKSLREIITDHATEEQAIPVFDACRQTLLPDDLS